MTLSYTLVIRNDMQTPSTEKIYKTINNTLEVINRNLTNIDKKKCNPSKKRTRQAGCLCTYFRGKESGKRRGSPTVKLIENSWEAKIR